MVYGIIIIIIIISSAERCSFFHKTLIPRNLLKEKISRIGPCETSRPDVSENVELIGRVSF